MWCWDTFCWLFLTVCKLQYLFSFYTSHINSLMAALWLKHVAAIYNCYSEVMHWPAKLLPLLCILELRQRYRTLNKSDPAETLEILERLELEVLWSGFKEWRLQNHEIERDIICWNITTQGHAMAYWLRHCTIYWEVAGSIPDGVTGCFHLQNPSVRTIALGSTQPLFEMSSSSIPWG
jgi:hypothetical protein